MFPIEPTHDQAIQISEAITKGNTTTEWSICDDVIHLREWGTERTHILPRPPINDCLVGTSRDCLLRLEDPYVSRKHAQLKFERGKWSIRDLGSRNGLRQDNARRDEFTLAPGTEISLGATTLIAESERLIELRNFCSRIIGWTSDRIGEVDHALRALRLAVTRRAALVLCGKADLVPVARALHRLTLGSDRPFIVCDPRRRTTSASVRSEANHGTALLALTSAAGGSLCVRALRWPIDFSVLLALLRNPGARAQLFVCANGPNDSRDLLSAPIHVSPLSERASELPRIIGEYLHDAIVTLNVPIVDLSNADRQWILDHAATSLPEIEKAALRVVALRASSEDVTQAADLLGMVQISLSNWLSRRPPLPPPPVHDAGPALAESRGHTKSPTQETDK